MMRSIVGKLQRPAASVALAAFVYGCGLITDLPPAEPAGSGGSGGGEGSGGAQGDGGSDAGGVRDGGSGGTNATGGSDGGVGPGGGVNTGGTAGADGSVGDGGVGETGGFGPIHDGGIDDGGYGDAPLIEASDCEDECDCDKDGYLKASCITDSTKPDCDDLDPRAHPGQTTFFVDESPNVGFDYNCDNQITPWSTTSDCGLDVIGLTCPKTERWIGPVPECGAEGAWGKCVVQTLKCVAVVLDSDRKQACR